MHNFILLLFAVAGGLAVSGIVANLYRILAHKPEGTITTWIYYAVMVLAGPSVLLQNATRSFRAKDCSGLAYGFAVTITGYWSLLIGWAVIQVL